MAENSGSKIVIVHTGQKHKFERHTAFSSIPDKAYGSILSVIEEFNADAVINPTNKHLSVFTGENSQIYDEAGSEFRAFCKQHSPVNDLSIVSEAYGLPVKKIIHLIGPYERFDSNHLDYSELKNPNLERLELAFKNVLEQTDIHGLKRPVMPLVGYSPYETLTFETAELIIRCLKEHLKDNSSVQKIICMAGSDYLYNLYSMFNELPENLISLFLNFTNEREEKIWRSQESLTKSIGKLDKAKKKIEKINNLLIQQKEEISAQNEQLKLQQEEILTQNEDLVHKNEEISTQKDELQWQKERMAESIRYAGKIQQAIMPSVEILEKSFPESFVLYRPCDVVSGDFFWFRAIGSYLFVVAADCTGHGIPGAFMSILGVSLLNDIVEKANNRPDEILNELRNRIKKSLHQTGKKGEQQDGMDIAFCLVDTESMKVSFSGAYNPLYLIRNNELVEYKADRMPIGIHPKDKIDFTCTDIKLEKGDTFYIFSDGYVSQFGGEKDEKFKFKRFRNLLLEISANSMASQYENLNSTLENWRGSQSQTDDILVIGLRV